MKPAGLLAGVMAAALTAGASTDYGPALWNPPCNANYYTSGNGHKFHVVHDMEGYYASVISMFNSCGFTRASIHYLVNGKQDASSDAAPGEITQMVRDTHYGWHARCWNTHSTGTEHEGFVSNPAWYTDAQYLASAGVTANLATKFGWAKDRNHVIGHDQKRISGWPSYASNNLGIDPYCNDHTDPGLYWDWSTYMAMVNGAGGGPLTAPANLGATTYGCTRINLSWTDKSANETGFKIEASTAGGTFAQIGTVGANVTSYAATGLAPGLSYVFRVRAYHATGNSSYATAAAARTVSTGSVNFKMDVNGDGKTDVVVLFNNGSSTTIRVSLATGTGFGAFVDTVTTASFGTPGVDRQWIPMDANGDGKTDFVLLWNNAGTTVARIYPSTGSTFGGFTDSTVAGTFGVLGVDRYWTKGRLDADLKEDLLLVWKDGTGQSIARTCLSTGTGFGISADSAALGSFGTLNVDRQWLPMDVNGDAKTDLVLIWNNAGTTAARTCLNNNNTFAITSDSTIAGSWDTFDAERLYLSGEVNGDGKQDLILIWRDADNQTTARACLSSGTGFGLNTDSVVAGTWGTMGVDRYWIPMDANGDGKTDLVTIWNNADTTMARICLNNANAFSITSDSLVAGSWDILNVNRLFLAGEASGDTRKDLLLIWKDGTGQSIVRLCTSSGSAFGITSDTAIAGGWALSGVSRLWFPSPH